jgi:tRNA modification GTPase
MRDGDTIVALSSGAVPSGVAVLRLSGPASSGLLTRLTGALPRPRALMLAALTADGGLIDRGLVAWFPAPHSFTGEDCAELQVHGSRAVVRTLLRWLSAQGGVRLAEAGEFTRRAFENGKLDLTEVEGLGDLIVAETEGQRRQALLRMDGALSERLEGWRERLLGFRAEIEARLDFSDEGDVAGELPLSYQSDVLALARELRLTLDGYDRGRSLREGFRIALAGPPNAGKSSLLNALADTDVAIVSDEPGTTRDVREVSLDIGGQLVVLVDMAGLRDAESMAEAEGVKRARRELERADLVLWLVAPDLANLAPPVNDAVETWTIHSKADLGASPTPNGLAVSSTTGFGLAALLDRISAAAGDGKAAGEALLISHERDRAAITEALSALEDVDYGRLELAGEALRHASHVLGRLIGTTDAEAVLDRLFSSFCIGK